MRKGRFARLSAFTLIELLTVIAITGVLLTLMIVPIVQSFNLTRSAQGFADAQDKARRVVERVSREVGNSAGIRDNSGIKGALAVRLPGQNGADTMQLLEYLKIDIIKPAEGDPIRGAGGALINPNTGRADPTQVASKGQVVLPVTPGDTIARYFVGRRDPFRGYTNPYDGLLMQQSSDRDNLYVLFRVEYQPYVWVGGSYVANANLFSVDTDGNPILDDPYFWEPDLGLTGGLLTGRALADKQARVRRWLAKAAIVTEVSRYDMIQPLYDKASRGVIYDNNVPRILPLAQFRPTAIGSEPAEGMAAVRLSEESDNMSALGPDVVRTEYGQWGNALVRVWPAGWDPGNVNANQYLVGRYDASINGRFGVFLFDPDVDSDERSDGVLLFDASVYSWIASTGQPYPFSQGLSTFNLGPIAVRGMLMAFVPDPSTGKVTASFDTDEVGNPSFLPLPPNGNSPTTGTGIAYSPTNDPDTTGSISDARYAPSHLKYEINGSFNKIWRDRPDIRPDVHRFVDLRVRQQVDGTPGPLNPDPSIGFARARIVPGSETVIGPDQRPGPHYGQAIRYSRTTREPGPNQYRINYVDQVEPTDYRLLGFSNAEVSAFEALSGAYSATNFLSAFIQPRFREGYVQFYSDPNVPLPQGNIRIGYRFQFTGAGDRFSVDYDSRQLISALITIRNYPQSSLPNPQGITVQATAAVRNILR